MSGDTRAPQTNSGASEEVSSRVARCKSPLACDLENAFRERSQTESSGQRRLRSRSQRLKASMRRDGNDYTHASVFIGPLRTL